MSARRGRGRTIVQIVGVLGGVALLGWCVAQAFKPANRSQLERLADAPAASVALLLSLSAAYVLTNSLILWCGIRPTRKVPFSSVAAVQAVCVVLGYVPLKLATVFRVLVHNRRDHVPVFTIGAWLINAFSVMLLVMGSLIGASSLHHQIDAAWIALASTFLLLSVGALVLFCRAFAGERGLQKFIALAEKTGITKLSSAARSRFFAHLHEGFAMLASPGWTAACVVLRLADIGVQSARFWVASRILGVEIAPDQCILIASTYFLIGILSPTGALGAREAGSTGLAAALGISALHAGGGATFAVVALTVSATEAVVSLALASLGLVWLRPDRLLIRRRSTR